MSQTEIGHHSIDDTFPPEPFDILWLWTGKSYYVDWPLEPEYILEWIATEGDAK